ncbi:MAG TPA: pseudouridine synthase [Candidatus Limnocylindria bacterium]|nr:pseudouridine synthase [Candidatus Limnocylindria bacterium]
MRLQKYLAMSGVASRRRAEEMIAAGEVRVNGQTVREMGTQVGEGDVVEVQGKRVAPEERKHYVLYYKPIGEVVTVSDPEGRPTVLDHFRDYPARLYPVGRLDFDSEGLLILTNDGELTNRLTHPSHEVEKRYIARFSNQVSEEGLRALRSGVMIEGHRTAPAKVAVLRRDPFSTDLLISIHEGRNRQIRRMAEAVGHQVVRLKRVQYGGITLGELQRGQWRELTPEEVESLRQ